MTVYSLRSRNTEDEHISFRVSSKYRKKKKSIEPSPLVKRSGTRDGNSHRRLVPADDHVFNAIFPLNLLRCCLPMHLNFEPIRVHDIPDLKLDQAFLIVRPLHLDHVRPLRVIENVALQPAGKLTDDKRRISVILDVLDHSAGAQRDLELDLPKDRARDGGALNVDVGNVSQRDAVGDLEDLPSGDVQVCTDVGRDRGDRRVLYRDHGDIQKVIADIADGCAGNVAAAGEEEGKCR